MRPLIRRRGNGAQNHAAVLVPAPEVAPPEVDDGWTTFTIQSGRPIYVSSSGSSGNTGLSAASPKQTIAQGMALMRNGFGDWLLLKKGDTFTGQSIDVTGKGPSSTDPWLISSYGTGASGSDRGAAGARPIIQYGSGNIMFMGGAAPNGGENLAVVGLDFYAYIYDPDNASFNGSAPISRTAINHHNACTYFLVEDCKFRWFGNAINTEVTMKSGIRLRRNVIVDCYGNEDTGNHSSGIFISRFNDVLLEGNLFDHNGWCSHGSLPGGRGNITVFNHNIYLQGTSSGQSGFNGRATVIDNIFANDGTGAQIRSGTTCRGNLFVHCPYGHNVGMPTAITSTVSENVYEDMTNAEWGNWGKAIETFNTYNGDSYVVGDVHITDNILTQGNGTGANAVGITLDSGTSGCTVINNIIYDYDTVAIKNLGTGNTVTPNEIEGTGYPDPTRTVASYNASLGGPAMLSSFLAEARLQSKDNWRAAYTAEAYNTYKRAGFA